MMEVVAQAHTCQGCGEAFPSKNKLFKHLKATSGCGSVQGSGAVDSRANKHLEATSGCGSEQGSGAVDCRAKKARVQAPCGRCQVRVSGARRIERF